MSQRVFLNNGFTKQEDAKLHFRDLSIQRGYGVFDFFKVVNSVPVFLDEHLSRFYFSAGQMRLKVDFTKEELKNIILELLKINKAATTGVRITLTGGDSADGYQISNPNLIIALHSFSSPASGQFQKGINLVTYPHQRQLPHVKSIDYLMGIWLQSFITQHSADDVLYHQNGRVTECPRSNFFIVTKDEVVVTPSENILNGVMRSKIMQLAQAEFKIEQRAITIDELKTAREAFITSTTKTVLPVRQIDDYSFSSNRPVTCAIYQLMIDLQQKITNPSVGAN